MPSNKSDIQALTSSYEQTILNGNLLYQGLNLPHNQPNLTKFGSLRCGQQDQGPELTHFTRFGIL